MRQANPVFLFHAAIRRMPFGVAAVTLCLFSLGGCALLEPQSAPRLESVEPATIRPAELPQKFTLSGSGFNAGTRIRLSLPADSARALDIEPISVDEDGASFLLDQQSFAELAEKLGRLQAHRQPLDPGQAVIRDVADQRYFHVTAINGKNAASRRLPLAIKRSKVRLATIGSVGARTGEPITALSGGTLRIPLEIAPQDAKAPVQVNARVYRVLKNGERQPVPGAGGILKLPPYTSEATIEIASPEVDFADDYEISFGIDCVSCIDYTLPFDVIENPEVGCPGCGPLFAPTGLEIIDVDADAGTLSLRWADNSIQETEFRIYGLTGQFATVSANDGTGIVEWTGPMPPATNPQTACYLVSAFNSYGEIESNQDCGLPGPPNAPAWLRVTDRETRSITIEWLDNSTTEHYENPNPPPYTEYGFEIYRSNCEDCDYHRETTQRGLDGTGPIARELTGLRPDQGYCIRVAAVNERGTSWSPAECTSTLYEPPPPHKPGQFSIYDKTRNSIELRWRDYAHNEDGFWVQRRYPDGERTNHAHLNENPGAGWMNWTDIGLRPNTTYCYRIKEYNDFGANFTGEKCGTTLAGAPGAPDLAFDFVNIVEAVEPNTKFHLLYGVCNMGGEIDGSFTDKVVKDGNYAAAKSANHGPLGAYECYQHSVEYDGVPEGCHIFEIHVDAPIETGGQIEEAAEGNNLGGLQVCFW